MIKVELSEKGHPLILKAPTTFLAKISSRTPKKCSLTRKLLPFFGEYELLAN